MAKKIPIDKYGEGNCCPECGSLKISRLDTVQIEREIDLKTEKEIFFDDTGKRVKPSNRTLARLYRSDCGIVFWAFKCRSCGWQSETMVP